MLIERKLTYALQPCKRGVMELSLRRSEEGYIRIQSWWGTRSSANIVIKYLFDAQRQNSGPTSEHVGSDARDRDQADRR